MNWTGREGSGRRHNATRDISRSKRTRQTTVRWTPDEIDALQRQVPKGMTLVAWIRSRALNGDGPAQRASEFGAPKA